MSKPRILMEYEDTIYELVPGPGSECALAGNFKIGCSSCMMRKKGKRYYCQGAASYYKVFNFDEQYLRWRVLK